MKLYRLLPLLLVFIGLSAYAQATRTWISGVGDDVNPCSRTAPCKTFAGAISKTADPGEINTLDPGGYGAVTITKSITLDGVGTNASIIATGTSGVIVNAPSKDIVIRNLSFNGVSSTTPGYRGIYVLAARTVLVENVTIHGFSLAGATNAGISIAPTAASSVTLRNVSISKCGTSPGVYAAPSAGIALKLSLDRVSVTDCGIALDVNDRSTVTVRDSNFVGNTTGIDATSSSESVRVAVDGSTIAHNGTGVLVSGAQASVRLSDSTVFANTTGFSTASSGVIESYNNNRLRGNGAAGSTDAVPTTTIYPR